MSGQVIDKKSGWVTLTKDLKTLSGSYTQVGYQGTKKEKDSDLTVVEVAVYNEFGTSRMPPRPFVRSYYDENVNSINKTCKNLLNEVIAKRIGSKQALGLLGEYIKSGIQKQIDKIFFPELSPKTIKKKGSTKPLIDTGTMRASVTHTEKIKGT